MADISKQYQWNQISYYGYVELGGCNFPVYEIDGYNTYEQLNAIGDNHVYLSLPSGLADPDLMHGVYRELLNQQLEYINSGTTPPTLTFSGFTFTPTVTGTNAKKQCRYRAKGPFSSSAFSVCLATRTTPAGADWITLSPQDYTMILRYKTTSGDYGLVTCSFNFWFYNNPNAEDNYIDFNPYNSPHYFGTAIPDVVPDNKAYSGINPGPAPGEPGTDPFEPIDPSGPSQEPPGTFDDNSDAIPDSSLPTLSSANTGFTRIYNPTLAQVQQLANYLWTDTTVIETIWNHIKQYFEDPMQAIIGFNLVPVQVPDGGTQEFKLMYIPTGVQMTVAASQFVDVDCGTLHLDPYYGSALDYAPNTKISCFLPYIGNVELNPDEIMNTTLQVKYRVDICSGSCVAKILVDGNVLYQYSGHCAINIPLSSADFSSYVSAAISVAKLGVGVATAGALGAAGLEAAAVTQATSSAETVVRDSEGALEWSKTINKQSTNTSSPSQASYTGITPRNISNTVGQIMGAKPTFQHSGSFSGNTGYLGVRRPYLIITRPNLCMPSSYQAMNGFPSMITMLLSECQGFTQVQQLHFQGSSATNPEVDEILQLLKSGVVF